MLGTTDVRLGINKPKPHREGVRSEQAPARILILGNLSGRGRAEGGAQPISKRTLHALDIDSLDSVLAKLKPRIHIEAIGDSRANLDVAIGELDDFHPDALYRKLDVFGSLREMRQRLLDPATVNDFLARSAVNEGAGDTARPPDHPAAPEDDAGTLERLLGRRAAADVEPPSPRGSRPPSKVDLTALIRDLVAPHVVPDADPRQEVYLDALDAGIRDQMRSILHHPSFQAVESVWRGLAWLLSELETGERLQLVICDLTREELLADLRGAADRLEESEFYRLVVEKGIGTPGGPAWSYLLGDFYLGHSEEDTFLLTALGAIASQAGAPFLAGAKAEVLGCRSLAETPDPTSWSFDDPADRDRWTHLRNSSQASWLGLALPRILLRLPYGSHTDEIEAFPFEELPGEPEHASFLWGNPAFACILQMGRALLEGGGPQQPGNQVLEGLPAYVYYQEDARTMKPCAEVLLGERAGQGILERGLIPLLSHRDRNAVSILRLQSLAEPPTPLLGL